MSDKYEVKYTIERYHQDVIELISLVGEYGIKQGSCLAERFFPEHFEDEFVDILVSVVKPEFAFFQMKVKSVFCQPSKAHKARLGEGPEAFNAINM